MIKKIEQWIDQTLVDYSSEEKSCECFLSHFNGFYPPEFLSKSSFVVVEKIPKPNFSELRSEGLGDFIDMDVDAITYKNTYFIKKGNEDRIQLHFHELVHVLQWQYLGAEGFISRYIDEILRYGYDKAPLEIMAYTLDDLFSKKCKSFDMPSFVEQKI